MLHNWYYNGIEVVFSKIRVNYKEIMKQWKVKNKVRAEYICKD